MPSLRLLRPAALGTENHPLAPGRDLASECLFARGMRHYESGPADTCFCLAHGETALARTNI